MNIKMWVTLRLYLLADRLHAGLHFDQQATVSFGRLTTSTHKQRMRVLAGIRDGLYHSRYGLVNELEESLREEEK
jgi:hypothetical protein